MSKEAHKAAKDAKEEGETWSDYLLRSTDDGAVSYSDRDRVIKDIREQLDRLEGTESEAENDPVDYAEIQTRVERALDNKLEGMR